MKKLCHTFHMLTTVISVMLILTISGSYATWYFINGRPPSQKVISSDLSFLFPMPIGGLTVDNGTELNPNITSPKLWGAGDDDGKVTSAAQGKDFLLKDYMPFEIGIQNHTTDKSLLISFEITFCLAPNLIEESGTAIRKYPFQDPFTITKNGETIGSGDIYYPYGTQTSGNVKLERGEKAFTYTALFISRDYYYYTAIIDPSKIEGFDVTKFVIPPSDTIESFQLAVTHTQDNDTACFATIKVIATEYTG